MNAGYFSDEEGKLSETGLKKKRLETVIVDNMKEVHNKIQL